MRLSRLLVLEEVLTLVLESEVFAVKNVESHYMHQVEAKGPLTEVLDMRVLSPITFGKARTQLESFCLNPGFILSSLASCRTHSSKKSWSRNRGPRSFNKEVGTEN